MGYGTTPRRWTVKDPDAKGNPTFDLESGDVLELSGSGNGDALSVAIRHRAGAAANWGSACVYDDTTDPAAPTIQGGHLASGGADRFVITIAPAPSGHKATSEGGLFPKDGGIGVNGTWTAEEGG